MVASVQGLSDQTFFETTHQTTVCLHVLASHAIVASPGHPSWQGQAQVVFGGQHQDFSFREWRYYECVFWLLHICNTGVYIHQFYCCESKEWRTEAEGITILSHPLLLKHLCSSQGMVHWNLVVYWLYCLMLNLFSFIGHGPWFHISGHEAGPKDSRHLPAGEGTTQLCFLANTMQPPK